jgi:hypothetical protein
LQRCLLLVGVVQDESIHSGADVEAFTAALNRELEGSASTASSSHTTDHAGEALNPRPPDFFLILEVNSVCARLILSV